MAQRGIIERIARIAEPVARSMGLEIWGIECLPSGRTLVRIYVDVPVGERFAGEAGDPDASGGMREAGGCGPDVDSCAAMSRQVAFALDAEDIFPQSYVLELSSPGLARSFFSLAQLAPYIGCELEAELARERSSGRNRITRGKLLAVREKDFILVAAGEEEIFAWEDMHKLRLVPDLPFPKTKKTENAGAARKKTG